MACTDFVVDARCYQDHNYAFRGIGYSTMSLLRHCPSEVRRTLRLVAVTSPQFPPMPAPLADVFDTVAAGQPPRPREDAIFFQPSPLTHDPRPLHPLIRNPLVFSAAFVHDFIPYDFPDIQDVGEFIGYERALGTLAEYDFYVANSAYTARRTREILDPPKDALYVSRIGARAAFFGREAPPDGELAEVQRQLGSGDGFFLSVAGDAPRKNIECAIAGVQRLNARTGRRFRLAIVGRYSPRSRARLSAGAEDVAVFLDRLSDEMLGHLYRDCIASILPSRVEGFSMPVVEGIAAGSLVVASACDAHTELVTQPEALFPYDRPDELCGRLEALLGAPALRAELTRRQAPAVAGLTEPEVGKAFWERLLDRFEAWRARGPRIAVAAKPSFAFVTPFLPHQSGVAIAMTNVSRDLARTAHVDVYTHAPVDAAQHPHLRRILGFEEAKHATGYDVVLYVLGNCKFHHNTIYDLACHHRQGNHVLLADSLMINMQFARRGEWSAAAYASDILKRPVAPGEYHRWMSKPQTCPILGFEEFFEHGWLPVVHSRVMQEEMERRGAGEVHWIPHATNVPFATADFDPGLRERLRQELGFADDEMVLVTMGSVSEVKGALECVMALRELLDWGYNPKLVFVGGAVDEIRDRTMRIARDFGVLNRVSIAGDYVTVDTYRRYLLAADLAIQLRKVPYGQTSGGLADCIGAGIVTVANDTMARAIDAPDFVLTVPDQLSPVLIAERLAEAREIQHGRLRDSGERRAYCASHSFGTFAAGLMALVP